MLLNDNSIVAVNSIIFADDSSTFRNLLSEQLCRLNPINKIIEVDNGGQVIEKLTSGTVAQLAILDLRMPILNGYETSKWIKQHQPTIKILVLTMYDDPMVKKLALQSGADAVLTKNTDLTTIQQAINQLLSNNYASAEELELSLTTTELKLLQLMCSDSKFEAIANTMNISLRQAERLREKIFKIFNIYDRASLSLYAIKKGIVITD